MNVDYVANPERFSKLVHKLFGGPMPIVERPLTWSQAVIIGQVIDIQLGSPSAKQELTKSIGTHGIEVLEGLLR